MGVLVVRTPFAQTQVAVTKKYRLFIVRKLLLRQALAPPAINTGYCSFSLQTSGCLDAKTGQLRVSEDLEECLRAQHFHSLQSVNGSALGTHWSLI